MKKYFILYSNGYFESSETMNVTMLHMIETGAIKLLIDCVAGKVWMKGNEGIAIEVKIPTVSGL